MDANRRKRSERSHKSSRAAHAVAHSPFDRAANHDIDFLLDQFAFIRVHWRFHIGSGRKLTANEREWTPIGRKRSAVLINLFVKSMPSHIQYFDRAPNHSINLVLQNQFAFIRVHWRFHVIARRSAVDVIWSFRQRSHGAARRAPFATLVLQCAVRDREPRPLLRSSARQRTAARRFGRVAG